MIEMLAATETKLVTDLCFDQNPAKSEKLVNKKTESVNLVLGSFTD